MVGGIVFYKHNFYFLVVHPHPLLTCLHSLVGFLSPNICLEPR